MIEKIIEWSAKNKFFILLGVFFAVAWGAWTLRNTPLDAIPDLSDVQVIVFGEWSGRSPDLVEDQVTYPIVTALISAPHVKVVRGYSFFGLSFVYVIFEDGFPSRWFRCSWCSLSEERSYRTDRSALDRVLVATPGGAQVPVTQFAKISLAMGAPVIKTEDAVPLGYVYVDVAGVDIGTYVKNAMRVVQQKVAVPSGYYLAWSGQWEYMQRAKETLTYVIPLTLLIILVLLYSNFKSGIKTLIVILSLPFALVGGIWLIFLLGYNTSVAVWVGFIALAGVAAETGVVMIVYLDDVYDRRVREDSMSSRQDLYDAIVEGAVMRVRPKMMTVTAIIAGLLPIMWSSGAGADLMKRIAAPMVGGMVTSTILTLIVIPVIYEMWRGWPMRRAGGQRVAAELEK